MKDNGRDAETKRDNKQYTTSCTFLSLASSREYAYGWSLRLGRLMCEEVPFVPLAKPIRGRSRGGPRPTPCRKKTRRPPWKRGTSVHTSVGGAAGKSTIGAFPWSIEPCNRQSTIGNRQSFQIPSAVPRRTFASLSPIAAICVALIACRSMSMSGLTRKKY